MAKRKTGSSARTPRRVKDMKARRNPRGGGGGVPGGPTVQAGGVPGASGLLVGGVPGIRRPGDL